jgi:hypothetical protein
MQGWQPASYCTKQQEGEQDFKFSIFDFRFSIFDFQSAITDFHHLALFKSAIVNRQFL